MDSSLSENNNKVYLRYKSTVKKWEKDFFKLNGRVPSKYDIKEATQEVRYAYKYYFNRKSEILESSLMDIPLNIEDGNITFSELDVSIALQMNSDNLNNDSVEGLFHAIPTADQIGKLMSNEEDCKQLNSCAVWGDHLNHKNIVPKKTNKVNKISHKLQASAELFKSCTFNKRNPRKSLSFHKSQSKCEDIDKSMGNESLINIGPVDKKQKPEIKNNLETTIFKDLNVKAVNPLVMMKNSPSVRNINPGWLSRCSDTLLSGGSSLEYSAIESSQNVTESVKHGEDFSKSITPETSAYGLKNLSVLPMLLPEDSCLSDFVENSESETEQSHSKSNGYRKIRPVVKRCKLDKTVVNTTSTNEEIGAYSFENIQEEPFAENNDKNSESEEKNKIVRPKIGKTKVKLAQNKKDKKIKITKKCTELLKRTGTRRSSRQNVKNLTSDSECDEIISKKTVATRCNRSKNPICTKSDEKNYDCSEYENNFIGDEKISYPRFPIKSSILKESNLVDGLAAALEMPKDVKQTVTNKLRMKNLSQEDKLQKKIDDGSLNENFVRINLEKKVYARGKKTMNFSKFKKQQWKNKKKMLHNTPEFPEGGILKCFKCGQPGHMSRYCKAGKGSDLLALDEYEEGKSPYISLKDAKLLNNTADASNISENIIYECFHQKDLESVDGNVIRNVDSADKFSMKGFHPIPDTFIKLLAAPTSSANVLHNKIEPLYQLASDGSLMDTPEEVIKALKLFGHTDFRTGQETAVMRILCGLSTLVTLSTGSGKSLCYQLPAYLYAQYNKCITLVISPLVSLMEDQVTSMPSFVHAACLHTNQSPTQREKIIDLIKNGNIHILLISPEAIVAGEKSTGFGAILRQLPPVAFACIDEVHCVSQWSHNFRPSYLMICRVLREKMGVKCVLGLTATATKPTISEIVQHLEITDGIAGVITNKPLPDNLVLTVSRDSKRDHYLLELLESERFSECNSIIVYCIRRDECERVASLLRSSLQGCTPSLSLEGPSAGNKKRKRCSWIVEAYHAGMSAAKRCRVQQAFMSGELRIVVATVAFGMGINKSDIRGVIHYNMPASFESYVQEVGRAGRDGLPAQCHAFIDQDFKDKDELLRHIHANSIERHVIRKLLQKIFVPCRCSKMMKNSSENLEENNKCQGHEVAFSVDESVSELDIPSENIATLLCYLELHPKKFAKVLSNVYIMCKIMSYGGHSALLEAAEKCPPLAMAIALQKKRGVDLDKTGIMEFCVVEVAAAIGWESGVVKYHLKNLEWTKLNGLPKKSLLRVEFNTLGFRVKAPGDLTSGELDAALDSLFERTQLQEKTMLHQLQEVSKALFDVSFQSIFQCSVKKVEETYIEHSNNLKDVIRNYFSRISSLHTEVQLDERPINKEQVITDVRGLLATYRDCTFTGRAVARILQGISSPNFPAIVWGRCRYWRSHISSDFYKLVNIGKQQIISMR